MEKRVVIITGGAQGIGKVTAAQLHRNGWFVVVADCDLEALAEMEAECKPENWLFFGTDVADEEQVKTMMQQVIAKNGRIDALVNNAMISANKTISALSLSKWNRVLAVNLTGPFLCVKYAEEALRESRGAVVNICSTRALQSEPNTEAYSASKGGLLALTHALAMSLGPEVRVNAVSPGWIDVSSVKKKTVAQQIPLSEQDHAQHPVGRVGEARDIANMIEFLLATENSFITAQNFIVDGGMTRKMIYAE